MGTSDLNYSLDFSTKVPPAEQDRIRDGMARADEHANEFWKAILAHCIWEAARRLKELTVDDVLAQLDKVNEERKAKHQELIETHNLSAIGPAMKSAAKEGIITGTPQVRRSRITGKKGNLQVIWKSNFYSEAGK